MLAAALSAELKAPWLPEAARGYAEERLLEGHALSAADIEPIAFRTLEAEDALLAFAPSLIVCDTDLLSTVVYARYYYGRCPDWIEREAMARRADLYLLCRTDLPWEADGVRDQPVSREALLRLFRTVLAEFGCTVTEITGTGALRVTAAVSSARAALDNGSRALR